MLSAWPSAWRLVSRGQCERLCFKDQCWAFRVTPEHTLALSGFDPDRTVLVAVPAGGAQASEDNSEVPGSHGPP